MSKEKINRITRDILYLDRVLIAFVVIFASSLFLQMCQNKMSLTLALNFAMNWHTSKFLAGTFVLMLVWAFISSLFGSVRFGTLLYLILIVSLGIADYFKMAMRKEPIYPDDLTVLKNPTMVKDIVGLKWFIVTIILVFAICFIGYLSIRRSMKLNPLQQIVLVAIFLISTLCLIYV
jgi:heme/copper-type cytochrome/quinol oxidase subunit 3